MKASFFTVGSIACILLFAGCGPSLEQVPFRYSSLNYSEQKPISKKLANLSLSEAKTRLIALAKTRGLDPIGEKPVKAKDSGAEGVLFMLKGKLDNKALAMGGGSYYRGTGSSRVMTVNLEYASKYYFELFPDGSGTLITAVGVPILNNRMSCPDYVNEHYENCKPEMLNTFKGQELSEAMKTQWGYDVSGKVEQEMIAGILIEIEAFSGK